MLTGYRSTKQTDGQTDGHRTVHRRVARSLVRVQRRQAETIGAFIRRVRKKSCHCTFARNLAAKY